MKKNICTLAALCFLGVSFVPMLARAGAPLFTFNPLTATTMLIPNSGVTIVQYSVQNQSSKVHTLVLKPIAGVTQITMPGNCANPFILTSKQTCTLTLQITEKQVAGNIQGGPVVCQQGTNGQPDPLLCYQPSAADSLNIIKSNVAAFYNGAANGNVYYSWNNGATWKATPAVAAGGSAINSIFAFNNSLYAGADNGFVYASTTNGWSWNTTTAPDGSAVNSVFVTANRLYAGTANGSVYYSTNNGATWTTTSQPDGSAVDSIFVTTNALYAGTANGSVYYSTNNGTTWISINGQSDGSAIKNIFLENNTLFVNTANEYTYASASLTGGGAWTQIAQTVYSLFVNAAGNLYAGTQSGYVYSVSTGTELGFITYTPINSLYITN